MRNLSASLTLASRGFAAKTNAVCLRSGSEPSRREADAATVRTEKTRPAQQVHTQLGKQETMSRCPTDGFKHVQGAVQKICRCHHRRQAGQGGAQSRRLPSKTADPELAPLIGHVRLRSCTSGPS